MATKITTDKIGKDGGTELTLPSSSQTLPTEGTANLQVNTSGEMQIGGGSTGKFIKGSGKQVESIQEFSRLTDKA